MSNLSRLATIVVVILTATMSPLAAQTKNDADDVAGKLDIAHIKITHTDRYLRFEMHTYERWRARILRYAQGTGENQLGVQFKTRRRNSSGVAADVQYKNGKLRVLVFGPSTDGFYVSARRPSKRTVVFRIPRKAVGATREWIRWFGRSTYSTYPREGSVCYDRCYDRLPQERAWFYYSLR
jgi:hypothetical protein